MNPWLIPGMISVTIMSGTLTLISLFLWLHTRYKFLFYWMIGWGFFFLRQTVDLLNVFHPGIITASLVVCFSALSSVYLLFGVLEMEGLKIAKQTWIWLLPVITTAWSLAAGFSHLFFWASIPAYVSAGLIHIYIGWHFLKMKETKEAPCTVSGRVLGYGMLLWGLHKLSNPIYWFIPKFLTPLGYILGGIFAFITSIFMLFWVVEKTGRERDISTESFRILFQNTADIILFISLDGKIINANPTAVKAYGYSRDELLEMNVYQLRRIDNPQLIEKQLEQANQTGLLVEAVHYRKDGSFFSVEFNSVGATIGGKRMLVSIVRDISGRKQDEAALRESEQKFRELFHNANDMIFLYCHTASPPIIEVNRIAMQKLGYGREEFNRISIKDLYTNVGNEMFVKVGGELKTVGHSTFELTLVSKTGTYFPVEVNAHYFGLNGQQVILAVARDISERQKVEAEIRNLTFKDQLTGLHNRVYLEEVLKNLKTEEKLPLSIIIGDVNGLKLVNDVFGHSMGDELLKGMAEIIAETCRKDDIVVRWGGDEFLLLLAKTDFKSAEKICQRIQAKCFEAQIQHLQPSIALGYAVMESADQDMQEIFRTADERMYRSKLLESKSTRNAIIASLQKTLSEKSNETEQHAERLKNLALAIGGRIGLPQNQMDDLVLVAMLHDIGKIAIPEELLAKPGSFTEAEWQTMKQHPEIGFRIIQSVPDLAHVAEAVLAHHERWDGAGYPHGIKETEIPLIARIISIVDSFDAMTHQRVYRNLVSPGEALAEIEHCAGTQFDPELVAIFREIVMKEMDKEEVIPSQQEAAPATEPV